jgi:hypothetical protein
MSHLDVEPFPTLQDDDESEIYEEEDCATDNEEEVNYDKVKCVNCSTLTHYSLGECSNCSQPFKMSKSGYLVSGEDGDFICDDDEDIVYISCEDDEEDEDEDDEDEDSNNSDDDDGSDDSESVVVDDEEEYVFKKKDQVEPDPVFRRITRSTTRT